MSEHGSTETVAGPPAATSAIELDNVVKRFGDVVAVGGVSVSIAENEFFSILGPSGCGKTTLMRMIAGFEQPTSGRILLMGKSVERLPSSQRDLNMVFQNYALFPHLSVFANVAFELKVRKADRKDIRRRVEQMLELVQLSDLGDRKPSELSGGQRQRVALARALVGHPAALLLDEPLGALDQKLRKDMQVELKRLQREVGITFIYVTHDQEEALTMSNRVAVMRGGLALQVDTPENLYNAPVNRFVADFIGRSNFLEGTVIEAPRAGPAVVEVPGIGTVSAPVDGYEPRPGQSVVIAVRPERIRFASVDRQEDANAVSGVVRERLFAGDDTEYFVRLADGSEITVRQRSNSSAGFRSHEPGEQVTIAWDAEATRLLAA